MSEADLDALADSARFRGLKLLRSRVRTPGKRRFGKVGLTDGEGKPVFGMDAKGPNAKPEAVEDYLRGAASGDWGASLGATPKKRSKTAAKKRAPSRAAPQPATPRIRNAAPGDVAALVELIGLLGAAVDAKGVRARLAKLTQDKLPPLVATLGKEVVGVCGVHVMTALHRDRPVGRINVLVVSEAARGRGIGRKLVEEAEKRFRRAGCELIEITSNDRLTEAHAFYRHLDYERTSIRFAKKLA